jgi:FixJ family two-component response regulator
MHDTAERVIAVVDDDDAVRDSLRFLLEIVGYPVATYRSAAQFQDEATVDHVACLIVDQHMPEQTGLQLVSQLRGRGVRLPVVLITGSASPDLIRRAGELSVVKVLEKPLDEALLLDSIARAHAW